MVLPKISKNSSARNFSSTYLRGSALLNPKLLIFIQAGAQPSLGLNVPHGAARRGASCSKDPRWIHAQPAVGASLNPKLLVFIQAGAQPSLGLNVPNGATRMGASHSEDPRWIHALPPAGALLNPELLVFIWAGPQASLGLNIPNGAARMGGVEQLREQVEGEEDAWARGVHVLEGGCTPTP